MTATINRRGQIVLRTTAGEKNVAKPGDVLVVIQDRAGRIVLEKRSALRRLHRSSKNYLNPPVLPSKTLTRIYNRLNRNMDKVEAEAVAIHRRALKGQTLKDL